MAILGICIKIDKLSIGKRCMGMHITRWQIGDVGMFRSFMSPGGSGGVPGRGGISSGVGCLCRLGRGAPVRWCPKRVDAFFVVLIWEGRHPSGWSCWSIDGCLCIAALTILCTGNWTPCFFSSRTSAHGCWIRYCASSLAVSTKPPWAILAIFKAGCMMDWSSCSRPRCLASVTDMMKT